VSFRDAGDAARDAGDWVSAVRRYEAHLQRQPDDWPIWVQLGHALKEMRRLDAADRAYLEALGRAPEDADLRLQLGHLAKLAGRTHDAVARYAEALALDPRLADAFHELAEMGELARARTALDSGAERLARSTRLFFFDVSDLFAFIRHHARVSGIQRVIVEFARSYLATREDVVFVSINRYGFPLAVDAADMAGLLHLLESREVDVATLQATVARMERRAAPAAVLPQDVYVILGAFWHMPEVFQIARGLALRGVAVGVYIHDLIPLSHPEFCAQELVHDFASAFASVLSFSSFFLTVSEHTARELQRYLDALGVGVPVQPNPLAHGFRLVGEPAAPDADAGWLASRGLDEPFVLSVSTIEARKNHALLFRLWRRLYDEHGAATPRLVLVGRMGWRVQDLVEQMRDTGFVGGRIMILHDLADGELMTLYRNCLFTTFPSHVEGWGLPVGEGLRLGRPCAASNASSIPEVGGDFVDYFHPHDLPAAETVFARLLFDEAYREGRAARIAAEFQPREWPEVADLFISHVERLAADAHGAPRDPAPELQPGIPYPIGQPRRPAFGPARIRDLKGSFALQAGWHRIEDFGVWAAEPVAELAFRAPGSPAPLVVYLKLRPSPLHLDHLIRVEATGAESVVSRGELLRLQALPDASGRVTIRIATESRRRRVVDGGDTRRIYVGLDWFGFAPLDDPTGQVALLEACLRLGESPGGGTSPAPL
jgi:glycosyltransferase involved in cell wall biosynthesis